MELASELAVRSDLPGRFNELDVLRRHSVRYELAMEGHVVPPYEVMIHPSSICNLRCEWCIGDHVPVADGTRVTSASKFESERIPDRLDVKSMSALMRELVGYERSYGRGSTDHTLRVETVNFSGLIGDPMVRKDAVFAAVDILRDAGRRVGMFTAGTLIRPSDYARIGRMDFIHISLDAASPQTYALMKFQGRRAGEPLFRRATEAIAGLGREAQDHGWPLQIAVGFVLYPQNYREVYEAAALAKRSGAHVYKIKRDIACLKLLSAEERRFAATEIERARRDLEDETFKILQIHDLEADGPAGRTFSQCRVTRLMASIGSDGRLYPCNYHPRVDGTNYGDVISDGFISVWEGGVRQEYLQKLPSICPPTCDPFKGRCNSLFEQVENQRAKIGSEALNAELADIIGRAYDPRHPSES